MIQQVLKENIGELFFKLVKEKRSLNTTQNWDTNKGKIVSKKEAFAKDDIAKVKRQMSNWQNHLEIISQWVYSPNM